MFPRLVALVLFIVLLIAAILLSVFIWAPSEPTGGATAGPIHHVRLSAHGDSVALTWDKAASIGMPPTNLYRYSIEAVSDHGQRWARIGASCGPVLGGSIGSWIVLHLPWLRGPIDRCDAQLPPHVRWRQATVAVYPILPRGGPQPAPLGTTTVDLR